MIENKQEKLQETLRSMFAVDGFMDKVHEFSKKHPEKSRPV